jgi:hypothetical protein
MPAGITLILVLGPLLPLIGWRNLWLASAVLASGYGVLLTLYAPTIPASEQSQAGQFFFEAKKVVRDRYCLALAITFFAYALIDLSPARELPPIATSRPIKDVLTFIFWLL